MTTCTTTKKNKKNSRRFGHFCSIRTSQQRRLWRNRF